MSAGMNLKYYGTNMTAMAITSSEPTQTQESKVVSVAALIDGFNLYHAMDWFDRGRDEADKKRYRKYKWLCLTSLVNKFIAPKTERLELVEYFTTYPPWDSAKELRHRRYVMAQCSQGVKITFGEFKQRVIKCKGSCKAEFSRWEEKQTDVNIATRFLELAQADKFDKLILITADSDQVPAIKLAKKQRPEKIYASLVPIGRGAKEICQQCSPNYTMTEQHLQQCQLPDSIRWVGLDVNKPAEYK